jgi:hypothetical protein
VREKTITHKQMNVTSYLKLASLPVRLLINFHESHLKDGIRRLIN